MPLCAGAAARDISPQSPTFLVGYPHVPRISAGVHDPLLASALCLRNGNAAVVLIALDLCFLDAPSSRECRQRIAARIGVAEEQVFISSTHTHSGPVTSTMLSWRDDPCVPPPDPAYMASLFNAITEAAAEAAERSVPAEIAWTDADALGVGGNRLCADGPTDSACAVLAVRAQDDGRLLALSTTYGMHPTVLHEDSLYVSSDFPHYTRLHLREALGEELVVAYHNGPCGNQSPRRAVTAQTFAEAERLGRLLGARILAAVEAIPSAAYTAEAPLAGALDAIETVPAPKPSVAEARAHLEHQQAEYARLQAEQAGHAAVRTAECAIFGAEEMVTLAEAQASGELTALHEDYRSAAVQAVRVGARTLVGWPCETFVEYALALKARSPVPVVPVELVNGELQGYIVTPEAVIENGYEAAARVFEPETGDRLVAKGLELVTRLAAGQ